MSWGGKKHEPPILHAAKQQNRGSQEATNLENLTLSSPPNQAKFNAPQHDAAQFLLSHLPHMPVCGFGKSDHQVLPLSQAIEMPYIQIGNRVRVAGKGQRRLPALILDVDTVRYTRDDLDDLNIPQPDVIVRNPLKPASAHYVWFFPDIYLPDGAKVRTWAKGMHREAWELFLELERWLVAVMGADKSLRALKTKNPLHPDHKADWRIGPVRELSELVQWIRWELVKPIDRETLPTHAHQGRNDRLYSQALRLASNEAAGGQCEDLEALIEFLTDHMAGLNPDGLPVNEVLATLKSAAMTAWDRRGTWKPGAYRETHEPCSPEETRKRRQASAASTNSKRRSETIRRLVSAGVELLETGARLCKREVARLARAGINTVRRHWAALMDAIGGDPHGLTRMQDLQASRDMAMSNPPEYASAAGSSCAPSSPFPVLTPSSTSSLPVPFLSNPITKFCPEQRSTVERPSNADRTPCITAEKTCKIEDSGYKAAIKNQNPRGTAIHPSGSAGSSDEVGGELRAGCPGCCAAQTCDGDDGIFTQRSSLAWLHVTDVDSCIVGPAVDRLRVHPWVFRRGRSFRGTRTSNVWSGHRAMVRAMGAGQYPGMLRSHARHRRSSARRGDVGLRRERRICGRLDPLAGLVRAGYGNSGGNSRSNGLLDSMGDRDRNVTNRERPALKTRGEDPAI